MSGWGPQSIKSGRKKPKKGKTYPAKTRQAKARQRATKNAVSRKIGRFGRYL